jgi:hypothetical protein
LLDTMITGTTDDLNEAEFVSRDVERSEKKHVGSAGWVGHTVKRWDGRRCAKLSRGV